MDSQYIPDELKSKVVDFFQSAAGKALLQAAKARIPQTPPLGLELHTVALTYAYRDGAEFLLNEIQAIPHESDFRAEIKKEKPLLEKQIEELTENDRINLLNNPVD